MYQAYLVVKEVYSEVGAVAVGDGDHVFHQVAKAFFKHFCTTLRYFATAWMFLPNIMALPPLLLGAYSRLQQPQVQIFL